MENKLTDFLKGYVGRRGFLGILGKVFLSLSTLPLIASKAIKAKAEEGLVLYGGSYTSYYLYQVHYINLRLPCPLDLSYLPAPQWIP